MKTKLLLVLALAILVLQGCQPIYSLMSLLNTGTVIDVPPQPEEDGPPLLEPEEDGPPILQPENPTEQQTSLSGSLELFAKCLTEKGVKFYGAYWCPHCQAQKELFGDAMKYVTYIECDYKGANAQPEICEKEGISAYPTWYFPNSGLSSGQKELSVIAEKSGCSL